MEAASEDQIEDLIADTLLIQFNNSSLKKADLLAIQGVEDYQSSMTGSVMLTVDPAQMESVIRTIRNKCDKIQIEDFLGNSL